MVFGTVIGDADLESSSARLRCEMFLVLGMEPSVDADDDDGSDCAVVDACADDDCGSGGVVNVTSLEETDWSTTKPPLLRTGAASSSVGSLSSSSDDCDLVTGDAKLDTTGVSVKGRLLNSGKFEKLDDGSKACESND